MSQPVQYDEKKVKDKQNGKKEVNLSLFIDEIIRYIGNSKEYMKEATGTNE